MTVVVDINVLLDVFQNRQPHYADSAAVVSAVRTGVITGVCPSHGIATLYYVMVKHGAVADAEASVDDVLKHFDIMGLDGAGWKAARLLGCGDLEDAAVAQTANLVSAAFIITRNQADFTSSPVPALTPGEFVRRFIPPP